ncbi:MAG: hypothetical protein J6L66_00220 [Anaerotignum sp.]|nr:hypothetical protein [Anaerotignum sp.]
MMFGRNTGLLAAVTVAMLLLGGCGTDGTVNEEQARNWYNEMQRNGGVVNDVDPDGYGLYSGGPATGDNAGDGMTRSNTNGERNTYGMRTDGGTNAGTTLGEDIRNAWDTMKNDVKNMGNDNAGGSNGSGGTNHSGSNNNGGK